MVIRPRIDPEVQPELKDGVHVLFGELPQEQTFSQLLHIEGPWGNSHNVCRFANPRIGLQQAETPEEGRSANRCVMWRRARQISPCSKPNAACFHHFRDLLVTGGRHAYVTNVNRLVTEIGDHIGYSARKISVDDESQTDLRSR